jgi:hypothetical protein
MEVHLCICLIINVSVSSVPMDSKPDCIFLNWNVRGLNNPARLQVVRDIVTEHHTNIMCLKETKLQTVDDSAIASTLGHPFIANYANLPADGTRGGIILACSEDFFTMSQVIILQHSITTTVTSKQSNEAWTTIDVYGLQDDSSKVLFLQELQKSSR